MESIDVDDFAKQLIADKCSALIESNKMLSPDMMAMVKLARDEYFKDPSSKNYEILKKLIGHTKYVDDSIDCKDFNRRMLLIAIKVSASRARDYFNKYKTVFELALKRLDSINPDIRSSPSALLQHYKECLDNLDNPRKDEHHLVTFAKEIATKIFIDTIDVYSYTNKSSIQMTTTSTRNQCASSLSANYLSNRKATSTDSLLAKTLQLNASRKRQHKRKNSTTLLDSKVNSFVYKAQIHDPPKYYVARALFTL
ncbi:ORF103 [Helicoverpa armigera SNPV]|uniref:ORF104 n=1 Tax=Helicoverpa zea single nucleopolyhedrovirus TaxID=10468 RepID=Q9E233_9ABAC|nr:Orf53-like protein [Helicoverpa zea single nucleopolyhedrovirus]AEN04024.1 hypothetical protein [Helicoverpa armigera NPV strain Australia]AIG63282.1 ORF103 [Helicoverpa armigera SNPV]AAL56110.1 ORF104 [Helicoverpa zea single nucleopolyhedrovirus]AHN05479.1 ORF104 [Helicoverpa zea single nucleopolyhedrovirus]